MSFKGKKNRYVCNKCGSHIVTIDREDGTTPFMVRCQVWPNCGRMESSFYRCDQDLTPTHEFYRMSESDAAKSNPGMREHHRMGGLAFRKIEEPTT